MAKLVFTPNLGRLTDCPVGEHAGDTIAEVLDQAFASRPAARSYVLDDQGGLRKHMQLFLNGEQLRDRRDLSTAVGPQDEITIMQALSGG